MGCPKCGQPVCQCSSISEASGKIQFLVLTTGRDDGAKGKVSSASKLIKEAEKLGHKARILKMGSLLVQANQDASGDLTFYTGEEAIKCSPRNTVVFVRGSAAAMHEGIALLALLERSGAMVVNSLHSTLLARNKLQSYFELAREGVSVPDTFLVTKAEELSNLPKDLGWPLVAKPLAGAEGIGITLIESAQGLRSSVQNYLRTDKGVILQKFMKSKTDYRALVLNGKLIGGTKRTKSDSDFRSNMGHGGDREPYDLPKDEREWAEKVARISGLYYSAIDYVLDGDEIRLLEVNGSPGSGSEYYSPVTKSVINGDALLKLVVETLTDRKNWLRGAKVAGLIEVCRVDNGKELECKLDSGNDSYNSLHAEDIKVSIKEEYGTLNYGPTDLVGLNESELDEASSSGSTVSFKFQDKNYKLPLVSTVLVRSGSSASRRPVVELDMVFDGREYKKVRFNLTDRSDKRYTVLLGAKFLVENNYSVNPATKHRLGSPMDELEEAAGRTNAVRALREFKTLMAHLDPTIDVNGFEVEMEGVKISANYNGEGSLTSLTLSYEGRRKRFALAPEGQIDVDAFQAKLATLRTPV